MHTNVRSIVVSGAESASSTPPVPPRRKKRKAKSVAIAKSPEGTSLTRLKKSDRKRLAPPPPPQATRRIRTHVAEDQPEETTSIARPVDDAEETFNSLSSSETVRGGTPSYLQFDDTDPVLSTNETTIHDDKNEICSPNRVVADPPYEQRPFIFETLARKETNKYPPLFFTLQDFQNVMSNTLQQHEEDDTDDKSPVEIASSIRDSLRESFENSLEEFEENELCFRVTTTNLPFEKCLDTWSTTFADHFIEKCDEPSRFIFEDYIDRSNKVNIRRSAGPMCYDSFEEEATVPRLTKVRFVIESPSSSTPDNELNEDGEAMSDSLQNIDPLSDDEIGWNRTSSSVRLIEITNDTDCTDTRRNVEKQTTVRRISDELADVPPLSSILKTRKNSSAEWSSLEDATNFIEMAGKEAFTEDEDDRVNSNDSFRASISLGSPGRSFKLKAADVSKAELSLIKSKTKCGSLWTKVKNDFFNGSLDNNNVAWETAPSSLEDNNESTDEDSSFEICENEGKSEETVSRIVDETEGDLEEESSNEVNANCIICEKGDFDDNEEESTINEIQVFDEELVRNEVENSVTGDHSIQNEAEAEIGEEVLSAEEEVENDEQLPIRIDSPNRSTQEYKRKIFVSESLRNMMNRYDFALHDSEEENQDSNVNNTSVDTYDIPLSETRTNSRESIGKNDEMKSIPITENNKLSHNNFISDEYFERRESISVPVDIRRNTFLENMLSEDSVHVWASCEIVATHPKTPVTFEESMSKSRRDQKLVDRLHDSIKMDPEIQKILQESRASLRKTDTSLSKRSAPKKIVQANKKSADDAKCDVLNELLSNFSNIRLKPVNGERKTATEYHPQAAIRREDDKEKHETRSEGRESWKNSEDTVPGDLTRETYDETINLQSKIPSSKRCNPPSTITGKLQNDHDKTDELQAKYRGNKDSGNTCSQTDPMKLRNYEISADPNEEYSKLNLDRDERTRNVDHTESSMSVHEVRVEPRRNDTVKNVSDERISREGAGEGSVERLQMVSCSEKTDANDESHNRSSVTAQQLELSRRTGSGDKSAIARRIPRPHCNNNDNNRAVTPVAVSDDQSRDIVTITPGRVRSFVKYYEIQRETTTDRDSKTNDRVDRDRMPEHQSVFSIRRGLEAKAVEARSLETQKRDNHRFSVAEKNSEKLICSTRREGQCAAIVEKFQTENLTDDRRFRDIVENNECEKASKMEKDAFASDSCGQQPGKVKRKKSVKFQGGFTVIGTRNPDEDGTVGSPAGQNANLPEEKNAPDRPTLKETVPDEQVDFQAGQTEELLDSESRSFEKRETAAQIQAAAKCEECSGINRFVPKPETPRLVFYCTV
ncbi:PREDICTED: uncharacterized protein LOC108577565 [Habropoda laboriosa]|uniref:uncharacterized protein LOC108577565 n=1 Tax=Habropoda laboriosa TaxID=597456 RepID=UPI00083E0511|nr:PREDICTED: uncharacterized protein LOC108577565 [Habropoda laboriosa]